MTRLTAICAIIFMATSMSLAYLSSAGDRELREFEQQQQNR
jgi:preprotein translocase subunit SecG